MQEHPEHNMAIIYQEDDVDQAEDEELAEIIQTAPSRKRLNLLLLAGLILVLIIFTYLGVTTLQHIPPSTTDNILGSIYHAIGYTAIVVR